MGENDAHPLTDEQLDALVDEIQDRLGDSTARKVGRRGVLAALGVAALGTGSASAQASGSVGTASNPVDVEGYDVTADNSFTDPAGVTHSGELADVGDQGVGQWQEVNSGSNIEPIDGETIGSGSEDVDVRSVSTDELNNGQSGRFGDVVYYDPRDSGPYVDGADALSNVPEGGKLLLAATNYAPDIEGPLTTTKTLTIEGLGWQRTDEQGTIIQNVGGISGPPIGLLDSGSLQQGGNIRNLYVKHDQTGPAMVVDNRQRVDIQQVFLYGLGNPNAQIGLDLQGQTAFCRVKETISKDFADTQIKVNSNATGSHRTFINCQTSATNGSGQTGISTGAGDYILFGEHDATATGVSVDNRCRVWGTFHESTGGKAIEVGSDKGSNALNEARGVSIISPRLITDGTDTLVRFGNEEGTRVYDPIVNNQDSTSELYNFTVDSEAPTVYTSYRNFQGAGITNNGDDPLVVIDQKLSGTQITNLPTATNVKVGTSRATRSPVWYSTLSSTWFETSKTTYTP